MTISPRTNTKNIPKTLHPILQKDVRGDYLWSLKVYEVYEVSIIKNGRYW